MECSPQHTHTINDSIFWIHSQWPSSINLKWVNVINNMWVLVKNWGINLKEEGIFFVKWNPLYIDIYMVGGGVAEGTGIKRMNISINWYLGSR